MGSANPVALNVPPVNVDAVGEGGKNPIKPPHGRINVNKAGAKREAIAFTRLHYLGLILTKRYPVSENRGNPAIEAKEKAGFEGEIPQ